MPSLNSMLVFSAAAVALLVVPGPAVWYILTRSAAQGRRAGLVSVGGIHLGTLVHVAAAVLGLSALLVTSATTFTAVKLAGAVYLMYLGARSLWAARRAGQQPEGAPVEDRSLRRVFLDGAVVNVLNPKTAVFFLAFVPQFVDPGAAHPTGQLLVFSGLFVGLGVVTDALYALAGGVAGRYLGRSQTAARRTNLVSGTAYMGLGLVTAVAGPTKQ